MRPQSSSSNSAKRVRGSSPAGGVPSNTHVNSQTKRSRKLSTEVAAPVEPDALPLDGGGVNKPHQWSSEEEALLIKCSAEGLDFDSMLNKYQNVFHASRTKQSLKSHYYRLKRANQSLLGMEDGVPHLSSRASELLAQGELVVRKPGLSDKPIDVSSILDESVVAAGGGPDESENTDASMALGQSSKPSSSESKHSDEDDTTGMKQGYELDSRLSTLDTFSARQILVHVRAIRCEMFARVVRPLLSRLMEHALNGGAFNSPVDPVAFNLPDYFDIIKRPMDLGTVRQKLESGQYSNVDQVSADVELVFRNAMQYNAKHFPIHAAAAKLLEEWHTGLKKLQSKHETETARRSSHACNFCQGQMCGICGQKCLRFDPPTLHCDCCGEKVKRSDAYYRNRSGHRWCLRCVNTGGIGHAAPGAVPPPTAAVYASTNLPVLKAMADLVWGQVLGYASLEDNVPNPMISTNSADKSDKTKSQKQPQSNSKSNNKSLAGGQTGPHKAAGSRIVLKVCVKSGTVEAVERPNIPSDRVTDPLWPPSVKLPANINARIARPLVNTPSDWQGLAQIVADSRTRLYNPRLWGAALTLAAYQQKKNFVSLLTAIIRASLEKRRNDEVVAEPWVQCDRCLAWVHQICGLFNARKNTLLPDDTEYVCPGCRFVDRIGTSRVAQLTGEAQANGAKVFAPESNLRHLFALTGDAPKSRECVPEKMQESLDPPEVSVTRAELESEAKKQTALKQKVHPNQSNNGTRRAMPNPVTSSRIALGVDCAEDLSQNRTKTNERPTEAATLKHTRLSKAMERRVRLRMAAESGSVDLASSIVVKEVSSLPLSLSIPEEVRRVYRWPRPPTRVVRKTLTRAGTSMSSTFIQQSEEHASRMATNFCSAPNRSLRYELGGLLRSTIVTARAARSSARMLVGGVREHWNGWKGNLAGSAGVSLKSHGDTQNNRLETICVCSEDEARDHQAWLDLDTQVMYKQSEHDSSVAWSYPDEVPYRQRVVLLFQRIEGVDVCVFALYVQEYGDDAPFPNKNCVYIAYLDSVRYLRPGINRTALYHELLAAYIADARDRGFEKAYIWACPPQRGEGYIFHRHPPNQRTPGKERLRQWYDQLLGQCQSEGTVDTITPLHDVFFNEKGEFKPEQGLPPFFAGDFWATESERLIREAGKRCGGAKRAKEAKIKQNQFKASQGHKKVSNSAIGKGVSGDIDSTTTTPKRSGKALVQEQLARCEPFVTAVKKQFHSMTSFLLGGTTGSPPTNPTQTSNVRFNAHLRPSPVASSPVYSTDEDSRSEPESGNGIRVVHPATDIASSLPEEERINATIKFRAPVGPIPTLVSAASDASCVTVGPLALAVLQGRGHLPLSVFEHGATEALRVALVHQADNEDPNGPGLGILDRLCSIAKDGQNSEDNTESQENGIEEECQEDDSVPDLLNRLGDRLKDMHREFMFVRFTELSEEDASRARLRRRRKAFARREPDQISCDFFDTRHGFLRFCQGNNYQFDTLRRAKHSSAMILWHLHNPAVPAYEEGKPEHSS